MALTKVEDRAGGGYDKANVGLSALEGTGSGSWLELKWVIGRGQEKKVTSFDHNIIWLAHLSGYWKYANLGHQGAAQNTPLAFASFDSRRIHPITLSRFHTGLFNS